MVGHSETILPNDDTNLAKCTRNGVIGNFTVGPTCAPVFQLIFAYPGWLECVGAIGTPPPLGQ
jgi:hypothetical protein